MVRTSLLVVFLTLVSALGIFGYHYVQRQTKQSHLLENFAFGNGRIEATEVNITPKIAGRLLEVYVQEGDIVQKNQKLAKLDTLELEAKRMLAHAKIQQAKENKNYALAFVEQKESELHLVEQNYLRAKKLFSKNVISLLSFEQDETAYKSALAIKKAAHANVAQAQQAIHVAVAEANAIQINIDESTLYAPMMGRILYKLAETGEVVGGGQNVLVLLNLLDTYITIFLPTAQAGVLSYGSEARIILDALPDVAIPAKVTFISPKAQFTPKQIETKDEREKLMFRVKLTIDTELLNAYLERVKTGLPAVAYVRLDTNTPWPDFLERVPKNYTQAPR